MDFRQVLPVPGLRGFRHLECRFLAGASGAWAAGFSAAYTPGRKTGLPPMAKLLFLSIAHFPSVDKQIREQAGTVYGSFHTKKAFHTGKNLEICPEKFPDKQGILGKRESDLAPFVAGRLLASGPVIGSCVAGLDSCLLSHAVRAWLPAKRKEPYR